MSSPSDPLVPVDVQPLAQRLAPADYEVVLFVAVPAELGVPGSTSECNAAAALVCGPEVPESWELALRDDLPADATGYGVDSGTGCFLGSRAARQIFEGDEVSGQVILAALERASGAVVAVEGGAAVAVFVSGSGDCVYDTWLGRDARGELSMILTDFGILDSADQVATVHAQWAARAAAKKWWQFWR